VGKVASEEVEHAGSADARLVCGDEIQAGWVSIQDVLIGFLYCRLKNIYFKINHLQGKIQYLQPI
jgi:hypothetical protein